MADGSGGRSDKGARPPRATVELDLRCSSEEEAKAVWTALSQDDPGSVTGEVVGDRLHLVVGPASLASLRASCDDVLSCFQAARGAAMGAGTGTAPGPGATRLRAPRGGEGV
jgi:hypothetical protein